MPSSKLKRAGHSIDDAIASIEKVRNSISLLLSKSRASDDLKALTNEIQIALRYTDTAKSVLEEASYSVTAALREL